MKVTKEICTFDELWENSWSGAKDTLKDVMEEGKEDALMQLLEELFIEEVSETDVNDFLWFDKDYIYEQLDMEGWYDED